MDQTWEAWLRLMDEEVCHLDKYLFLFSIIYYMGLLKIVYLFAIYFCPIDPKKIFDGKTKREGGEGLVCTSDLKELRVVDFDTT